jgi:ABC-2 type transport system permease protein
MPSVRLGIRRFGAINGLGLATLMKREASRGLKDYNYQLLGPAVTALLYLAVFRLALHNDTPGDATGQVLINFIAPGVIIFSACEKAYESAAGSFIFDKHEKIIADMLMAPLTAFERMVAYVGADCLGGLAVGVAVAAVSLVFAELGAAHPWAILVFGLLGMVFHSLVGLLVGIWAEKWDQFSAIHTFLLVPLSFLSGMFYPIEALPAAFQNVMQWNPLYHAIAGFRYGMSGTAAGDPMTHVLVLVGVNLVLAVWAYRWFRSGYKLKP